MIDGIYRIRNTVCIPSVGTCDHQHDDDDDHGRPLLVKEISTINDFYVFLITFCYIGGGRHI